MTTRSNRSDSGHRPKAGEVSGQESFWFFWDDCQKKLAQKARSAWAKAFVFLVATRQT